MKSGAFKKFIAVDRWHTLYQTYLINSDREIADKITTSIVLLCVFISLLPILSSVFLTPALATIVFGISCVLAICVRIYLNFVEIKFYKNIKIDLSITHTAFAFGCIPAVLLLLASPETVSQHADVISQSLHTGKDPGADSIISIWKICSYLIFISIWSSVLEEVIYRGLLLSALRRWSLLNSNKYRDLLAISISAIVFGFAHYHTWGLFASLSLVGLGFGLGIAYICTEEKLLALIIYHFLFDLVSLTIVAIS